MSGDEMASTEPQREDARLNLVTVAEVAERLSVSRMTVYRLVHSGELPALRVGRSYRVPKAAVDAIVEQHLGDYDFGDDARAVNG